MGGLQVSYGQVTSALWAPLENSDWPLVPTMDNDITDIKNLFT